MKPNTITEQVISVHVQISVYTVSFYIMGLSLSLASIQGKATEELSVRWVVCVLGRLLLKIWSPELNATVHMRAGF
jgi:hypothetical protein